MPFFIQTQRVSRLSPNRALPPGALPFKTVYDLHQHLFGANDAKRHLPVPGRRIEDGPRFISQFKLSHCLLNVNVAALLDSTDGVDGTGNQPPVKPLADVTLTFGEQLDTDKEICQLKADVAEYDKMRKQMYDTCCAMMMHIDMLANCVIDGYASVEARLKKTRQITKQIDLTNRDNGNAIPGSPSMKRNPFLRYRGRSHLDEEEEQSDTDDGLRDQATFSSSNTSSKLKLHIDRNGADCDTRLDVTDKTAGTTYDDAVPFSAATEAEVEVDTAKLTKDDLTSVLQAAAAVAEAETVTKLNQNLIRRVSVTSSADSDKTLFDVAKKTEPPAADPLNKSAAATIVPARAEFESSCAPEATASVTAATVPNSDGVQHQLDIELELDLDLTPKPKKVQSKIALTTGWVKAAIQHSAKPTPSTPRRTVFASRSGASALPAAFVEDEDEDRTPRATAAFVDDLDKTPRASAVVSAQQHKLRTSKRALSWTLREIYHADDDREPDSPTAPRNKSWTPSQRKGDSKSERSISAAVSLTSAKQSVLGLAVSSERIPFGSSAATAALPHTPPRPRASAVPLASVPGRSRQTLANPKSASKNEEDEEPQPEATCSVLGGVSLCSTPPRLRTQARLMAPSRLTVFRDEDEEEADVIPTAPTERRLARLIMRRDEKENTGTDSAAQLAHTYPGGSPSSASARNRPLDISQPAMNGNRSGSARTCCIARSAPASAGLRPREGRVALKDVTHALAGGRRRVSIRDNFAHLGIKVAVCRPVAA
ncbi:hypothetical protein OC842_005065 [Tilletia horrida]|uniref:Uncharacterized protein n=1 Tax=Tilletia horrida TaxID=155126 RepID=A0AAN6JJE8_9BASI|nr:hypothetical protein OC842_005065 [Tilletia horrida]